MAQWKPLSRLRASSAISAALLTLLAAAPLAEAQVGSAAEAISAPETEAVVVPEKTDVESAPDATVEVDPMKLPQLDAPVDDPSALDLQLEVKINGYAIDLIAGFKQLPDGKIASHRSELREIGIAVPGEGPDTEMIALNVLPGLSYVYDAESQTIELEVPDSLRFAKSLSTKPQDEAIAPQVSTGLAVNYTLFGAAHYHLPGSDAAFDGANLSLDARAFSKFGTLRQSGVIGTTTLHDASFLRLDTVWSYSDVKAMRTYRLGDIISGGPSWVRPIRMGGAQIQRNFSLRPDLVTMPLPKIKGSAAVPSVLDVYLNESKAYSSDVSPGPFALDDLPVFTDSGVARIVLTDATGRSTETYAPFFTSSQLLAKGLFDYSAEAGVVRRDYGSESFGYGDQPVGLASFRYGLSDAITIEGHAEGKSDLLNGGFGAVVSAKKFGVLTGAVAASKFKGDTGFLLHGSWQARYGNLQLYASTSRRFGEYYDLAAATAEPLAGHPLTTNVPKAVDQITLGYSMPKFDMGLGASLIHQKLANDDETLLLSGTVAKTFRKDISVFASANWDILDKNKYAGYLGVSFPLGQRVSTSASLTVDNDSWSAVAEASRPMGEQTGDYGWRVSHGEGTGSRTTSASGTYRSQYGVAEGNLGQRGTTFSGNAAFSGSVVVAGGGIFAGNTINDAFAVVNAGAPGVEVTSENRLIGKTGKNGRLLVPNLRSYNRNTLAINVADLPVEATIGESFATVVPRDGSGVVVDFRVKEDGGGALVTLVDAQGKLIDPGFEAVMNGTGDPFIVGFDGQIFVTGAKPRNSLVVSTTNGSCTAEFDYKPDGSGQTDIGQVTCQ